MFWGVFRRKFAEALRRAYDQHELDIAGGNEYLRNRAQWHAFDEALFQTDWVVYAKPRTSEFSSMCILG